MISTGIKGLDSVITGLREGDNVVWQIDDIKDYAELVKPFVEQALKEKRKVVYMRFASHKELLKPSLKIKRYELNAYAGFESFATKVNNIITQEGEGTYYVFDCLSELLSAWATDLMIGNFFMVTCPYLYELKTVTYFSILRYNHSFKSVARIRETTQLLIDVYHCEGCFYIHPLKVWNRYSPTMFLPHQRENDKFIPITDSVNAVKLLSYIHEKGAESAKRNLDYWDLLFIEAEELARNNTSENKTKNMVKKLCNIMLTKNKKILSLAMQHFSLEELIEIHQKYIINPETSHLKLFFDEKWNSTKETVSFGHDIEANWLLCEAAEVLGNEETIKEIQATALKMAQAVYEQGLDTDGSLFYEGENGKITAANKDWWPQAEAVVGFINAYQLSKQEHFFKAAEKCWAFIQEDIVDSKNGEWFWDSYQKDNPKEIKYKVSEWKCPYHNSRACLEIIRRTKEILK